MIGDDVMMKKYMLFLGTLLLIEIFLIVCGNREQKQNNLNAKTPSISKEPTSSDISNESSSEVLNAYYKTLQSAKNKEEVYQFIEWKIESVKPSDADAMVNGLFDYIGNLQEVDFKRLAKLTGFMSEEMRKFVTYLSRWQEKPVATAEGIAIPLAAILERSYLLENLIELYPNGLTYPYTYELYAKYLSIAVTGQYAKESGIKNYYMNPENQKISTGALSAYQAFVKKYPDTKTASVVNKYIKVLRKNKNKVNDQVEEFYITIYAEIRDAFDM